MNFLKKIFGVNTLYDEVKKATDKVVVDGYRSIARQKDKLKGRNEFLLPASPPSFLTKDWKIIEIYSSVLTAYQKAASKRQEIIPAKTLNFIAYYHMLQFEIKGMIKNSGYEYGNKILKELLKKEIQEYSQRGLDPKYVGREIDLINCTFD